MKFGFKYIKYIMMLEKTLKVKDDVLRNRNKENIKHGDRRVL